MRQHQEKNSKVDFGFERIEANQKTARVKGLFGRVANNYDIMNDLMSLGLHRLWKDEMVKLIPKKGCLLDVAGGTGDIAIRYLQSGGQRVVVCDLTPDMLAAGQRQADRAGFFTAIEFVEGDAEQLPFADKSFDAVTIAFGLRNITNKEKSLSEMRRVLKPGGQFVCLEFSKVVVPGFDRLYQTYNFSLLPLLGKYVARQEDAYRYLAESIAVFYSQEELVQKMKLCGFEKIGYQNLMAGIVALHYGQAPL
ncbi:MAG: bifunctional demethylmenaquinone methyltransferase/2-methoxy-6-polyprenyl-1,4-benzoquinol methylase UbiE [Alphaproteobacteria bacterium]|nr:bifunctional demethylmenaquinone methyltransferase/2-methoxy-6-polyprenyl-1,4-benzoquinol methylase UbiE [Alphaproteobacteria bacterium]